MTWKYKLKNISKNKVEVFKLSYICNLGGDKYTVVMVYLFIFTFFPEKMTDVIICMHIVRQLLYMWHMFITWIHVTLQHVRHMPKLCMPLCDIGIRCNSSLPHASQDIALLSTNFSPSIMQNNEEVIQHWLFDCCLAHVIPNWLASKEGDFLLSLSVCTLWPIAFIHVRLRVWSHVASTVINYVFVVNRITFLSMWSCAPLHVCSRGLC